MSQSSSTPCKRENAAGRRRLIFCLFFLSGFAALIYEASWSRLIGLALGNTAQAAALVLAATFVGLAAGQLLGGALVNRVSPLLGYGIAELAAAVCACLVPTALNWVGSPVDREPSDWFRDSSFGQAVWCLLILVPATLSLGTTLPFVIGALASQDTDGGDVSLAYGLNTAGGFFGIIIGTAFLLVTVGVSGCNFLAAVLSSGCGSIACAVDLSQRRTLVRPTVASSQTDHVGVSRAWIAMAAISGFGTLALEVLYTRMFALIFHNSAFTFAAIVAGFLLALSLGAITVSYLAKRFVPEKLAAAGLALGGVILAVSVAAFPRLTGLKYFTWGDTFAGYMLGAFGLILLIVLPPVTLLGLVLPSALHAVLREKAMGLLIAVNTLSAAAGALAAGFLLPPLLGLWSSFALIVALFVLAGAFLLLRNDSQKHAAMVVIVGAGAIVLIAYGLNDSIEPNQELIRRWESAYGWVDVVRNAKENSVTVRQNLHYRHGSTESAAREYRQARLPLLLHPVPRDVAVLGLGTGLTAAPVVADQDVERAVIIELIPEVVEASRLLTASNLGVVDHPKVELCIDDARHELSRNPRQFDVIVSDLFVPWENRTGYLYTVEFYATVQRRLKPGGLFCQWLALYQVGPEQFELIADSFASVFPHTTIWWGQLDSRYAIVGLVGSQTPLRIDIKHLTQRFARLKPPGRPDPDLHDASDLAALYLGDWRFDRLRRLNTDEHPWLEFTAPVSQRSGQTLHGRALRRYFDQVFSALPADIHFARGLNVSFPNSQRRRAFQRLSLFGDVRPE